MVGCISAVRVNAVWRTNVEYGYFTFKVLALVIVIGTVFFDDTVSYAQRFSGDFAVTAIGYGVEIHMRNEDFFAQFKARLIVIYGSIFWYWKGLAVAVFTVGLQTKFSHALLNEITCNITSRSSRQTALERI